MGRVGIEDVRDAIERTAAALDRNTNLLTELDQAVGDGDLGITAGKIAAALRKYVADKPADDVGTYVAKAGMAVNRAASSSFGTLLATALMSAGKEVKGQTDLAPDDLAVMLHAADAGIQKRGKAKPGDKTIIDVTHPAAEALREAVDRDATLAEAGQATLRAAREGMEAVKPLRSKIGRAGWVGERTEGKIDPGCAASVIILEAITQKPEEPR